MKNTNNLIKINLLAYELCSADPKKKKKYFFYIIFILFYFRMEVINKINEILIQLVNLNNKVDIAEQTSLSVNKNFDAKLEKTLQQNGYFRSRCTQTFFK
jgi:hypothetical protein